MEMAWDLLEQPEAMAPEVFENWHKVCHMRSPVDQLCADIERSVIILSPPGAGLSTALALLPRYQVLSFAYPPSKWPGTSDAFTNAPTHLEQWMGHVAQQIAARLHERPLLIKQLTFSNLELLIWLTYRYRGERARDTLLQRLTANLDRQISSDLTESTRRPDFQQLYGSTGSERAALIDECVTIARLLGWKGIFAAIDVSWTDWAYSSVDARKRLSASVRELLSTLSPLQIPGFGYKMGLSTALDLSENEVRRLIRGRALVTRSSWTAEQIRLLIHSYINAVGNNLINPHDVLSDTDWAILIEDLRTIWGGAGPAGAAALIRQLLEQTEVTSAQRLLYIRRQLYTEQAVLWPDPNRDLRAVWRGAMPIAFEETPFRFFELLWRERGRSVGNETLMPSAGHSQDNLDKNINRVRTKLEPFYGKNREYIYIQRSPSQGTRLTCYLKGEDI